MNKIFLCAGNKGGTGKSMVATALIDAFLQRGVEPFVIETDDANPDVFKAHSETVQCAALSLDEADGWIELINSLDKTRGVPVIVNTAARNSAGVARYGQTLKSTLGDLGRTLVTLWVINRQRDSLELLADYLDVMPVNADHQVHVVRNLYYGSSDKFQLYSGSELKKRIEGSGGKTVDFPDLADRVADELATKRLTLQAAMGEMPLGHRAELIRWRDEAFKTLSQVM
ncbi:MAG: protein mobD [Zoogloea sp.]|uniref:nucleotide-binding protein n=1 Tax=Zoogloea sp. TaxID=49181 RepID=UPI00260C4647|nr:protein mobD [Zoogloea sp.]MDD3326580.1 protein mobD [Zoogloea sp.]